MADKKESYSPSTPEFPTQASVDRLTRLLEEFDRRTNERTNGSTNGTTTAIPPEVARDIAIVTSAYDSIKKALALEDNPIAVTSSSWLSGPAGGGQDVTLEGSHFLPGATVSFGTNAATDVVVEDLTHIRLKTPAGVVNTNVPIVVRTIAGSASLEALYHYV
jgi:hypothetical protein